MDCGYVRRHTVAQSMLEQPHRRRKRKRRRRRRKHTKPYPLFQAVQGNWPIFLQFDKISHKLDKHLQQKTIASKHWVMLWQYTSCQTWFSQLK